MVNSAFGEYTYDVYARKGFFQIGAGEVCVINRVIFLEQLRRFGFGKDHLLWQENHIQQPVDIEKLETVICLESLLDTCYQALEGLIDNEHICKECRRFEYNAQYHQKELRRIFALSQESETAIENKVYQYLLQLKPPFLFIRAVINLAIGLTAYKMDIYKYFSRTNQGHHEFFNNFFEDSVEEMNFLHQERKSRQNSVEDMDLKVPLD